jgi:hypothetical protein
VQKIKFKEKEKEKEKEKKPNIEPEFCIKRK